ncbi:ParB/RepB/Spo0J family partition protein [Deinococcus fonticola]|uniref:ParB/RepB/Spo0J family partition protein n=1 Tax=Deinococcus fonticola TaxID=2528713 RepID=UPI001074E4DA|nr:ParB/RepB/Spo0J family partition protein [Deinococcus fonticola]
MTRRTRPERKRDLQGLLGQDVPDLTRPVEAETLIAVERLRAGLGQPRRQFDDPKLQALAQSVREQGVLQPLLVRKVGQEFEIVAGERRWRAAQLAGLSEVPVIIRDLTDVQARQVALIENLQREDLNTLDEVDAKLELVAQTLGLSPEAARTRLMQLLREEPGAEHAALDEVFAPLGEQWTSFTRNKLKILNWPTAILDAVRGGLAYTLAQLIVPVEARHHTRLLNLAASGASRAELQAEIRKLTTPAVSAPQAARVARVLGSSRWLSRLSSAEQQALEQWLKKMPQVLRSAVDD